MSLGSGSGFDTGLWDMFGFDVKSARPELPKAITLLVLLMRKDPVLDIPKGAYYPTFDVSQEFPQVVITFEEVPTTRRGPGWRRDQPKVHVFFRFQAARHQPQGRLAAYAERLAALLEENPRLGDVTGETGVNRARVTTWKPVYRNAGNLVEDAADVTVEMFIHRRVP